MPKTVRPLTDSIGPGNLHSPEVVSGRVRNREGGLPAFPELDPPAGGINYVIRSYWMSHVLLVATGGSIARTLLGLV